MPSSIQPKVALLSILSYDAAKGVLKLNPQQDEKVLITGMGVIGLLACYFLKYYVGVEHVDVVEPNKNRRDFAKNFGAKNIYDSEEKIIETYNYGFECSATNSGFHALQKALKTNGQICILSDGNNEIIASDGISSFIHVEDAARATMLALNWPSGIVNIVDNYPATSKEWLPIYAAAIGAPQPKVQDGKNSWERGASNNKARKEYGWIPLFPSWSEGFNNLIGK
ncbi:MULTISPECIES: zinc-binding dehydrogenase [Bacillus cereus group]|uniref:zinc-binding dehydrogenase n=1 Tax=Bacillus cereus group TaxID=86661 RepID=UPI001CEF6F18|nr:zinc-binding dehydrogenase [Bacillus cereus]